MSWLDNYNRSVLRELEDRYAEPDDYMDDYDDSYDDLIDDIDYDRD